MGKQIVEDPNFYFDFEVKYFNYIRAKEPEILKTAQEQREAAGFRNTASGNLFTTVLHRKISFRIMNNELRPSRPECGVMFRTLPTNNTLGKLR